MSDQHTADNPELESLFQRYERAPKSNVFAPLADACRKVGLVEEALEICDTGLGNNPNYASGYVVQGKCYYDISDWSNAQIAFARVLALDPHNLVALKFLGMIAADRGDGFTARQHFQRILDFDPDNKEIIDALDDVETEADNTEAPQTKSNARVATTRVEAIRPDEAGPTVDPVDELSDDLPAISDDEFEGNEISLGESETSDLLATKTLAGIYASQGYNERAIRIYRDVLKADPGDREVREILVELGEDVSAIPTPPEAPMESNAPKEVAVRLAKTTTPAKPVPDTVPGAPEAPEVPANKTKPKKRPNSQQPRSHPLDAGTRDYSQFKRWLKKMSND